MEGRGVQRGQRIDGSNSDERGEGADSDNTKGEEGNRGVWVKRGKWETGQCMKKCCSAKGGEKQGVVRGK